MLEIRDGVNCFKFKDRQVLITPDLKKLNIPLDLIFPPPKIENLSEKLLKRFKKRGVIVSSIENRKKPSYKTQCILEKITFRNIDIEYVDNIFQECLKNSSMAPLITIDCSLEVTSKLLNLIHRKYSENSINPIIKIFIKDSVEDFLKIIREFLNARESIELNNLFLIIQHKIISNELINNIKESIDPLELYLYYENIPDYITNIEAFNWDYNLPILLEINERMTSLNLNEIKRFPIVINEDSIFRLLSAFKLKSYTVNEFLRKQLFLPYCGACNNRIFIEGRGKIAGKVTIFVDLTVKVW